MLPKPDIYKLLKLGQDSVRRYLLFYVQLQQYGFIFMFLKREA
jgi:hypothetical protein